MIDSTGWTIEKVYEEILSMQKANICAHEDLLEIFTFFGFEGYKKWQEYKVATESMEHYKTKKCEIKKHHKLIELKEKSSFTYPKELYKYTNTQLAGTDKASFVKNLFAQWENWEKNTKDFYVAAAEWALRTQHCDYEKFMDLAEDTSKELAHIQEHMSYLQDMKYDIAAIRNCQSHLRDKYECKMKIEFKD